MLCVPVEGEAGEVVGVVQFVNKRATTEFNSNDIKLAKMMAHHVAIFLAQANKE